MYRVLFIVVVVVVIFKTVRKKRKEKKEGKKYKFRDGESNPGRDGTALNK